MSEDLRYERAGAAAVLTIDRPRRRNAIDAAAAEGFRQGLADFEADSGARVLILTGAGGIAFCAGADLKAMDLDVDHPHGPMGPTRLVPSKPAIAAPRSRASAYRSPRASRSSTASAARCSTSPSKAPPASLPERDATARVFEGQSGEGRNVLYFFAATARAPAISTSRKS